MKTMPVRTMRWSTDQEPEALLSREWLATNGLGGYASGTVSGVATRRFHGLLVAALPTPTGRAMMLNHLFEKLRFSDGSTVFLGGYERQGASLEVHSVPVLREFRLDGGLPVWLFELVSKEQRFLVEKRIFLVHNQNTVHLSYRVLEGVGKLRLKLRPSVSYRPHEGTVAGAAPSEYSLSASSGRYEIVGPSPYPSLRMHIVGDQPAFTIDGHEVHNHIYRIERDRGYDHIGALWSPGYFRADLANGRDVTLTASTESWEALLALSPEEALAAEYVRRGRLLVAADPSVHGGMGDELVLAADQFIITPGSRVEDAARAAAAGDEVRTVSARQRLGRLHRAHPAAQGSARVAAPHRRDARGRLLALRHRQDPPRQRDARPARRVTARPMT